MPKLLQEVVALLDLEAIEENLFRGNSPQDEQQRVFGGQVLGQALTAAGRTVSDRAAHSLHAYFLRAGDPSIPIVYQVERLRDGRSFSTRRVTAIQHGRPIFVLSTSFQVPEESVEHQSTMPSVPDPETLPTLLERARSQRSDIPSEQRQWMERERAIDMRHVDVTEYLTLDDKSPENLVWIRANGSLPDDPLLHQCVVAYASDMTIIDTAMRPHTRHFMTLGALQIASLDHAMWFHRPVRADEWMLYAQESDSMANSRGFARARLFRRDGTLACSVVQEGLMRVRAKEAGKQ